MNQRTRGVSEVTAVAIVVALVVVAGLVVVEYAAFSVNNPKSSTSASTSGSSSVRVFGLVGTTGAGTRATELVFEGSNNGTSTAPVVDGRFSVEVPNHRVYNVTLVWVGNYTWQMGLIELGQLSVEMEGGSMMAQSYNVVQSTPDAVVLVNGTLAWQVATCSPTAIKFTASDGQAFQTDVVGRVFSVRLPNAMTFDVTVAGTNSSGYTDWYYFHQLQVEVGVGVVGLEVRLG